jgi:DNA-binding transcriptional LysR family regulator
MVKSADADQGRFDPTTAQRMFTVRTRDIGEAVCFPKIYEALADVAPNVQLRTVFRPINETLSGMASGQIDFALGFLPALESGIHSRLLFKQHYVCAMRKGHPLATGPLTLDRFSTAEHLLVEYAGSGHQQLERALVENCGKQRVKIRLPQYLAAPYFIVRSDLLWTLPAVLAESIAQHYPIAIKPHPLPLDAFEIGLYWHDRYHRDPANKWLRDLVVKQFEDKRIF